MCTTSIMGSSSGTVSDRGGCLGHTRRTGRKMQAGKHWKSSWSSQQHAKLQRRRRSGHSPPPHSLQVAGEHKHSCKKQMIAQACSYSAACGGTAVVPVFSMPLGVAAGPSATLLPLRHPLLQRDVPDDGKKWGHLSLQPCTSTPGVRRKNGIFFGGGCLSSRCIIFCRNVLYLPVHVHVQPHRLQSGEPQDRISTRARCQVVTHIRLYPKTLSEVLLLSLL